VIVVVILAIAAGIFIGKSRGIPFVISQGRYAIGIYEGKTPLSLQPAKGVHNPVLTNHDVTDIEARFVADPFLLKKSDRWYMFFEVYNEATGQGDIGLAESPDGRSWEYQKIILDEDHHLSYPFVFEDKGEVYMVPESHETYNITLYRAVNFPTRWEPVKELLKGNFSDSTIFSHGGLWWMFTSDRNDILHLFYSDSLTGDWKEHPASPVVFLDANKARPAGRIVFDGSRLFRFTQDCDPVYGLQVDVYEITELNADTYTERKAMEKPVVSPTGKGWNALRMHQVDAHRYEDGRWIAAVDGVASYTVLGFQY